VVESPAFSKTWFPLAAGTANLWDIGMNQTKGKTPAAPKIMSTERVRRRFSEEQIRHMVERSLYKMSQCPGRVTEWVSHYRTVYGEVTVVYAKEPHSAIVAYDDEVPKDILAKPGTHSSGYRLTDEEWKKHAQAMWRATGGSFDAPMPRPDHRDVAGIGFVTEDKDLVSLEELANDRFFNDIEKWYEELAAFSGRFKVAAVAYHSDGETYHYAPVLGSTDDISTFPSMCREMFGKAYRKFITEIPDIRPNVIFTALWVEDDDLDYVRTQLCTCVGKAAAIVAGDDTHFQRRGGIAFFHAATASLTEGEQFELTKSFDIETE
jgi:hypothetical protein